MATVKKYSLGVVLGIAIAALVLGSGGAYLVTAFQSGTFAVFRAGQTKTSSIATAPTTAGALEAAGTAYSMDANMRNKQTGETASFRVDGQIIGGKVFLVENVETVQAPSDVQKFGGTLRADTPISTAFDLYSDSAATLAAKLKAETGATSVVFDQEIREPLVRNQLVAVQPSSTAPLSSLVANNGYLARSYGGQFCQENGWICGALLVVLVMSA